MKDALRADSRVYVAGHRGMVGSALVRALAQSHPDAEVITATRSEVDLCEQAAVRAFLRERKPDVVLVAAAKVGGIHSNSSLPADFIHDNLSIALHVIGEAYRAGVRRLVFLGSTCIYPRLAPQPMPESCLLTGPLEPTNEAYAVAKIAGLKLCEHFRAQYGVPYHSVMPTNLYGPGDNYDPLHSHVLPALLRRFHEARLAGAASVTVWGSGTPRREFLHVDDCARAVLHLAAAEDPPDLVNIGTGVDVTIAEVARAVAEVVGFQGELVFDTSKPDGTPRKLTDTRLLAATGWSPRITLADGLADTYRHYLQEVERGSVRGH